MGKSLVSACCKGPCCCCSPDWDVILIVIVVTSTWLWAAPWACEQSVCQCCVIIHPSTAPKAGEICRHRGEVKVQVKLPDRAGGKAVSSVWKWWMIWEAQILLASWQVILRRSARLSNERHGAALRWLQSEISLARTHRGNSPLRR